jgi:diguanylate cyclase (GGDEF)-like protein
MIDALLLLQDVQLLCFTVIFFFVSRQHPTDRVRRWLWYSFLANAAGALMDFTQPHLPAWVGRGLNLETIPLSYALITVAFAYFLRRYQSAIWISFGIMLLVLPSLLLWSGNANHVRGDELSDLVIGLQVLLLAIILPLSVEKATRSPRLLMAAFFYAFAAVELIRAFVGLLLGSDPDVYSTKLSLISSIAYVVSTSVLPLAFVWMMNSRLESDLIQQNLLDPLTQVLNRRGLRQVLDLEMAQHLRSHTAFSFAIVDLDHFKQLNDTFGHASGDAVLIGVASLLKRRLRSSDTVARMGGEEFVLLLPDTDQSQAVGLLEELRIEIELYSDPDENIAIKTTASFGGTTAAAESAMNVTELLREADVALYRAKQEGRNRVKFFTPELDSRSQQPSREYLA